MQLINDDDDELVVLQPVTVETIKVESPDQLARKDFGDAKSLSANEELAKQIQQEQTDLKGRESAQVDQGSLQQEAVRVDQNEKLEEFKQIERPKSPSNKIDGRVYEFSAELPHLTVALERADRDRQALDPQEVDCITEFDKKTESTRPTVVLKELERSSEDPPPSVVASPPQERDIDQHTRGNSEEHLQARFEQNAPVSRGSVSKREERGDPSLEPIQPVLDKDNRADLPDKESFVQQRKDIEISSHLPINPSLDVRVSEIRIQEVEPIAPEQIAISNGAANAQVDKPCEELLNEPKPQQHIAEQALDHQINAKPQASEDRRLERGENIELQIQRSPIEAVPPEALPTKALLREKIEEVQRPFEQREVETVLDLESKANKRESEQFITGTKVTTGDLAPVSVERAVEKIESVTKPEVHGLPATEREVVSIPPSSLPHDERQQIQEPVQKRDLERDAHESMVDAKAVDTLVTLPERSPLESEIHGFSDRNSDTASREQELIGRDLNPELLVQNEVIPNSLSGSLADESAPLLRELELERTLELEDFVERTSADPKGLEVSLESESIVRSDEQSRIVADDLPERPSEPDFSQREIESIDLQVGVEKSIEQPTRSFSQAHPLKHDVIDISEPALSPAAEIPEQSFDLENRLHDLSPSPEHLEQIPSLDQETTLASEWGYEPLEDCGCRFTTILPTPVAEALQELGRLEPATIAYLYDKYGDDEKSFSRAFDNDEKSGDDKVDGLERASSHNATKSLTKQSARRAARQIQYIQQSEIEVVLTAHRMVVISCDQSEYTFSYVTTGSYIKEHSRWVAVDDLGQEVSVADIEHDLDER